MPREPRPLHRQWRKPRGVGRGRVHRRAREGQPRGGGGQCAVARGATMTEEQAPPWAFWCIYTRHTSDHNNSWWCQWVEHGFFGSSMLTQHPSNSDSLEVRCYLPTSNCSQRRHGPTGVHDRPTGKEFQIFGIMDVLEKFWRRDGLGSKTISITAVQRYNKHVLPGSAPWELFKSLPCGQCS